MNSQFTAASDGGRFDLDGITWMAMHSSHDPGSFPIITYWHLVGRHVVDDA